MQPVSKFKDIWINPFSYTLIRHELIHKLKNIGVIIDAEVLVKIRYYSDLLRYYKQMQIVLNLTTRRKIYDYK